ncbi:hypothetical protein Adt_05302 [Abeliophyllum distichum]|uniref:Uncharacterized protein n=1 Tax=Abeliophyllum distichum TaxID=126358 RepID=A0ABD1V437_9LAMI
MEGGIKAEARAPTTNHSHQHSEPCNSRCYQLTHLKNESVLLGPPMSLKGLVSKLTPAKESPTCLNGEDLCQFQRIPHMCQTILMTTKGMVLLDLLNKMKKTKTSPSSMKFRVFSFPEAW